MLHEQKTKITFAKDISKSDLNNHKMLKTGALNSFSLLLVWILQENTLSNFFNICHKLNSHPPVRGPYLTLNKKIYVGYKTLDPDRHCKLPLAFMEMNSIFYEVLELIKLYKPKANNRMFTVFFFISTRQTSYNTT